MTFDPVFLDKPLGNRAAQTFLRHANACMRSGYLYAKYRGEASTVEMQRGRALHSVCERSTRLMVEMGEATVPPEVVKDQLDVVLRETPVPVEEHDYLREAAYRWASEFTIDPAAVVACETLFTMRVGDWDVRCRVDYADLSDDGAVVHVVDYKSGRGAATQEDVARVRSDGTLHAKNFQLILYALVLVHGVPVREEECATCEGEGAVARNFGIESTAVPEIGECPTCDGRGRIETPEPFPAAARAQRFDLAFVYPGIEDREGKMLRRPVTLTRLELEEYRSSLEALVQRVADAERTGDWPAVVSDAACSECPASVECPIPAQLRAHRGTVNSEEAAAEALVLLEREKADHRARQTELRNFVKSLGGSLRADGKVWELVYSESETLSDRDGLIAAMERGEPVERSRFFKAKGRTEFKSRDLTPEELEVEQAEALEDARTLDEKFGTEAPY